MKVRLIIPLYIICEKREKTREGRERLIVLAPCFHKSAMLDPRTSCDIANKVVTSRDGRGGPIVMFSHV